MKFIVRDRHHGSWFCIRMEGPNRALRVFDIPAWDGNGACAKRFDTIDEAIETVKEKCGKSITFLVLEDVKPFWIVYDSEKGLVRAESK